MRICPSGVGTEPAAAEEKDLEHMVLGGGLREYLPGPRCVESEAGPSSEWMFSPTEA